MLLLQKILQLDQTFIIANNPLYSNAYFFIHVLGLLRLVIRRGFNGGSNHTAMQTG